MNSDGHRFASKKALKTNPFFVILTTEGRKDLDQFIDILLYLRFSISTKLEMTSS